MPMLEKTTATNSSKNRPIYEISNIDILSQYNIHLPLLGKGKFGDVRRVFHKETSTNRAMKIISIKNRNSDDLARKLKEAEIQKQIDHKNIIKIYDYSYDKDYIYIMTEQCSGGNLYEQNKKLKEFDSRFSEIEISKLFKQVLDAVAYLHGKKIIHRDQKPLNIIFSKDYQQSKEISEDQIECIDEIEVKLADFGTSVIMEESTEIKNRVGTPGFMAPEVQVKSQYNEKCDIWSLGIMLYSLLSGGIKPYVGVTKDSGIELAKTERLDFSQLNFEKVSEEAKDLIRKMLRFRPDDRISSIEAVKHKWFDKMLNDLNRLNDSRDKRRSIPMGYIYSASKFMTGLATEGPAIL